MQPERAAPPARSLPALLFTGVLGLNAFAVGVGAALFEAAGALWTLLALSPLALGLVAAAMGMTGIASATLLVGVPISLGLSARLEPSGGVLGALSGAVVGLAFIAYLGAATSALRAPRATVFRTVALAPSAAPKRLRPLRALTFVLVWMGAFALAVILPRWDGQEAMARAFGDASIAASTFVATVGTLLGASLLLFFYAPITRAEKHPSLRRSPLRFGFFLLVAALVYGLSLR